MTKASVESAKTISLDNNPRGFTLSMFIHLETAKQAS